jgi:hypothetical protein
MKHQSQIINLDASLEEIQQAGDDMVMIVDRLFDRPHAFASAHI